jgi:hypothetical protein
MNYLAIRAGLDHLHQCRRNLIRFVPVNEEKIRLPTLGGNLRHLAFIDPVRVCDDPALW